MLRKPAHFIRCIECLHFQQTLDVGSAFCKPIVSFVIAAKQQIVTKSRRIGKNPVSKAGATSSVPDSSQIWNLEKFGKEYVTRRFKEIDSIRFSDRPQANKSQWVEGQSESVLSRVAIGAAFLGSMAILMFLG